MKFTNFSSANRISALDQTQLIKHGGVSPVKKQKESAFLLPLTSLIDAFSIIVIYLLIGTQSSGLETEIRGQIVLPNAESGQMIDTEMSIVRIEKNTYYINDKMTNIAELGTRLASLKKDKEQVEILIQADQSMDYSSLDPIIKAASAAGIQKLKFAVIPKS